MSWLTIAWSMGAASCLLLAAMQGGLGLRLTRKPAVLWFCVMAACAGVNALIELGLLQAQTVDTYRD